MSYTSSTLSSKQNQLDMGDIPHDEFLKMQERHMGEELRRRRYEEEWDKMQIDGEFCREDELLDKIDEFKS